VGQKKAVPRPASLDSQKASDGGSMAISLPDVPGSSGGPPWLVEQGLFPSTLAAMFCWVHLWQSWSGTLEVGDSGDVVAWWPQSFPHDLESPRKERSRGEQRSPEATGQGLWEGRLGRVVVVCQGV
jgi:hypothetical protein